jgi:NAD(P)H-hydrate repair Nnr-like enzyme with NAD(P)H-hydrate dehydratase domain
MFAAAGRDVALADIDSDPGSWAARAADAWNVTVLLKGATTHVCSPQAGSVERFHARVVSNTNWMATAGTGDVLAGICGALVATHALDIVADPRLLGPLAATAAFIHVEAGARVSSGGPVLALDVAEALPALIASLL